MRFLPFVVALLVLVAGCTAAPRGLHWTIDFESTALHDQTRVVEARILRGSCTGAVVYRTEVRATGAMAMSPPDLPPGTYAFAATAYDATCTVVGDDCQSIDLPGPAAVTNLLRAHAGAAACAPALCHSGSCEMDSGMPDTGTPDVGTLDVGPNDGGMDAAMPDMAVCTATETACTNGTDDDCDGHTDCADTDCAPDMACALCNGVTCSDCQACDPATGMCRAATNGDVCPGGHCAAGACCTGCIQGGACQAGTTSGSCGSGGNACTTCGECTACNMSGMCVGAGGGASCSGGAGHCTNGSCCTGCVDPSGTCMPGSSPMACGSAGTSCLTCGECHTCTTGACMAAGDGTGCTTGSCLGGACCNGCFIVGTCQPGTAAGACGPVGGSCVACGECRICDGTRNCAPAPDGTSCTGGSCVGGSCCTGCTQGGACQSGNAQMLCGNGGSPCGDCNPTSLTCNTTGVCTGGIGDSCLNAIDITGVGNVFLPIDTCLYTDNVSFTCSGGPAPDVVLSGLQGHNYHLDVPTGWIVGYLDPSGSCAPVPSACGRSYGSAGSTGQLRFWFAVERADGGCGRVTIQITNS